MKFVLRSSLHPELACGVLGVGSVKVESRVSGARARAERDGTRAETDESI